MFGSIKSKQFQASCFSLADGGAYNGLPAENAPVFLEITKGTVFGLRFVDEYVANVPEAFRLLGSATAVCISLEKRGKVELVRCRL